ncbi:MAG: O-antigen ligase family protein [Phycisphaerales bacterium]|nr:O-antigen ligase family protein [Phycisphaerales bacterium]
MSRTINPELPAVSPVRPPIAVKPASSRLPWADKYLLWLSIVLCGYAMAGRGFAYIGVPPLFIGEFTLMLGLVALVVSANVGRIMGSGLIWLIVVFMGWGAMRTIPYIHEYGIDALRDGMTWGYASYAIIVAALIAAHPERLLVLMARYRKFVWIVLLLGPIFWLIARFAKPVMPLWPWANVELIEVKGGDYAVHLGGVYAYLVSVGRLSNPWVPLIFLPIGLAMNVTGRAAMLSFILCAAVATALRPLTRFMVKLPIVILLLVAFGWGLDAHLKAGPEVTREISVTQLFKTLDSILPGNRHHDLDSTKEWRLDWWDKIVKYTIHGPYFWTGKGFGVNLANDDGFQVFADESLRSPHSAHLSILARTGVPGLSIWIALHAAWILTMFNAYFSARKLGHKRWCGIFAFIMAYWIAFIINASFDVYLEGPMGAIWFWSLVGFGIGAVWVHKNRPWILESGNDAVVDRA